MSHDSAYPAAGPDDAAINSSGISTETPGACWAALAPLLAGRPLVRESRDATPRRRGTYSARWARKLTDRLPPVPAAVPVYASDGSTRVLVVDLDVSKGGIDAVRRDAAAVAQLVWSAGGAVISDQSPNGGRHVYVPLAEPVSYEAARTVAVALARRTPSMDPTPNQNVVHGLIRPPGSAHRAGGHQRLHGSLSRAVALARTGNPPAVWEQLYATLATELAEPTDSSPSTTDVVQAGTERVERRGSRRQLASQWEHIARTGDYDTTRYPTPSEARQAVLTAAAAAGHTLTDVLGRLAAGTWPGLQRFYNRYSPGNRTPAIRRDWTAAHRYLSRPSNQQRSTRIHVHNSPTSRPPSQRGAPDLALKRSNRGTPDEYRFIRTWWNAFGLVEVARYADGRAGIGRRIVLRALGEAAMKTGSRYIAFGVRSLAVATGLDHTTVAAHLRALREEADPFIDLIESDRGLAADLYCLRVPDDIEDRAARRSWRPGRIHALRPVFRELGAVAALVYEALEQHRGRRRRSFDLVTDTGLSRTAIWNALRLLAIHNLVDQQSRGWTTTSVTYLDAAADQYGVIDTIRRQVKRHCDERAAYRRILRTVNSPPLTASNEHPWPPPDVEPFNSDSTTPLDLLERMLGAYVIA